MKKFIADSVIRMSQWDTKECITDLKWVSGRLEDYVILYFVSKVTCVNWRTIVTPSLLVCATGFVI
jgi:hypothetical protein